MMIKGMRLSRSVLNRAIHQRVDANINAALSGPSKADLRDLLRRAAANTLTRAKEETPLPEMRKNATRGRH